jgi:2-amino-4-hydroxy-6-hydroxymethyldihydropteridine diphosphokinase
LPGRAWINDAAPAGAGAARRARREARARTVLDRSTAYPCGYFRDVVRAFIGLGSNVGDRETWLRKAVGAVGALPGTDVRGVSQLRDTEPVGVTDQPRFLNGALEVETTLGPRELLEALLEIEHKLGRDRSGTRPGGPRTVDLDLLLYGDALIAEPGLAVPHPRLAERRFALEPLADLDPDLEVPAKGRVQALLAELR